MKEAAKKKPVELLRESEQAKKDEVLDAFVQKYLDAAAEAAAKAAEAAAEAQAAEAAAEAQAAEKEATVISVDELAAKINAQRTDLSQEEKKLLIEQEMQKPEVQELCAKIAEDNIEKKFNSLVVSQEKKAEALQANYLKAVTAGVAEQAQALAEGSQTESSAFEEAPEKTIISAAAQQLAIAVKKDLETLQKVKLNLQQGKVTQDMALKMAIALKQKILSLELSALKKLKEFELKKLTLEVSQEAHALVALKESTEADAEVLRERASAALKEAIMAIDAVSGLKKESKQHDIECAGLMPSLAKLGIDALIKPDKAMHLRKVERQTEKLQGMRAKEKAFMPSLEKEAEGKLIQAEGKLIQAEAALDEAKKALGVAQQAAEKAGFEGVPPFSLSKLDAVLKAAIDAKDKGEPVGTKYLLATAILEDNEALALELIEKMESYDVEKLTDPVSIDGSEAMKSCSILMLCSVRDKPNIVRALLLKVREKEKTDVLHAMIKAKYTINGTRCNPLEFALSGGYRSVFNAFVDNLDSLDFFDESEKCSLMCAAAFRNPAVLNILLKCFDQPVDVILSNLSESEEGTILNGCQHGAAPIVFAVDGGNVACLDILIKKLDKKEDFSQAMDAVDKRSGVTVLMQASAEKSVTMVRSLLKKAQACDLDMLSLINKKNSQGKLTALMIATEQNNLDVLKALLEPLCDEQAIVSALSVENGEGMNAFMIAAHRGHVDVVKFFIEKLKAAPDHLKDLNDAGHPDGHTALSLAMRAGHAGVVGILLEKAGQYVCNRENIRDLLKDVVRGNHEDILPLLLASINALNLSEHIGFSGKDGEAFFSFAAEYIAIADQENEQMVCLLLEAFQKNDLKRIVEFTREDGRTVLINAAEEGCENIVNTLLANDAMNDDVINARNADGERALTLAAKHGHEAVVRLLMQHSDINLLAPYDATSEDVSIPDFFCYDFEGKEIKEEQTKKIKEWLEEIFEKEGCLDKIKGIVRFPEKGKSAQQKAFNQLFKEINKLEKGAAKKAAAAEFAAKEEAAAARKEKALEEEKAALKREKCIEMRVLKTLLPGDHSETVMSSLETLKKLRDGLQLLEANKALEEKALDEIDKDPVLAAMPRVTKKEKRAYIDEKQKKCKVLNQAIRDADVCIEGNEDGQMALLKKILGPSIYGISLDGRLQQADKKMARIMANPLFSLAGALVTACKDKGIAVPQQEEVLSGLFKAAASLTWLPDAAPADHFWTCFKQHYERLEAASQSGDAKSSLQAFVTSVKQDFLQIALIEGGTAQWDALQHNIDAHFVDKKGRPLIVKAFARLATALAQVNPQGVSPLPSEEALVYKEAYQKALKAKMPEQAASFVVSCGSEVLDLPSTASDSDSAESAATQGGGAGAASFHDASVTVSSSDFSDASSEGSDDKEWQKIQALSGRVGAFDYVKNSREHGKKLLERLKAKMEASPDNEAIQGLMDELRDKFLAPLLDPIIRKWPKKLAGSDSLSSSPDGNSGDDARSGDDPSFSDDDRLFPGPSGIEWGDSSDDEDGSGNQLRGVIREPIEGLNRAATQASELSTKDSGTVLTQQFSARVPHSIMEQVRGCDPEVTSAPAFFAYVEAIALLLDRFQRFYDEIGNVSTKGAIETLLKHPVFFFSDPGTFSNVFLPLLSGEIDLDEAVRQSQTEESAICILTQGADGRVVWQVKDTSVAQHYVGGLFLGLYQDIDRALQEGSNLNDSQNLLFQTRLYLGLKALSDTNHPILRQKKISDLLKKGNECVGHAGKALSAEDRLSAAAGGGGSRDKLGLEVFGFDGELLGNVTEIAKCFGLQHAGRVRFQGQFKPADPVEYAAYVSRRNTDDCPHKAWAAEQTRAGRLLAQEGEDVEAAIEAVADQMQQEFQGVCGFISSACARSRFSCVDFYQRNQQIFREVPSTAKIFIQQIDSTGVEGDQNVTFVLDQKNGSARIKAKVAWHAPLKGNLSEQIACCQLIALYRDAGAEARALLDSILVSAAEEAAEAAPGARI